MSTVLFQDGDWRICLTGLRDNSAVYHNCTDAGNTNDEWWHISSDTKCMYCKTEVPDEIQGLWILYAWDK